MEHNIKNTKIGWLEVVCGPMFSGKSEELLRKLKRLEFANIDFLIFKPSLDSRSIKFIISRNGSKRTAIEISDPYEIYNYIEKSNYTPRVIAIDEVQFLDAKKTLDVVDTLKANGYIIYVSGLDSDFRNHPFETTSLLMANAETVTKLSAICSICGAPGTCTQRVIDGKPASYSSEILQIGDFESYTSRCKEHHELPDREFSEESRKFIDKVKSNIKINRS